MTFALYFDEDSMHHAVHRSLTNSGVNCLTTNEAGRQGQSDDEQLKFAADSQRTIVTGNQRDFVRLYTAWANDGRSHAGIIIISEQSTPPGVLIAKLMKLQRESDPPPR